MEKSKYCDKALSKSTIEYLNMFERLKNDIKVNPGDIVCLKSRYNNTFKTNYNIKILYKVESIHESGLVIAKQILANNKTGPSEIINDGRWMVNLDTTYVENIIMKNEENYDPSISATSLKKEKLRVTNYNRSICVKTRDEQVITDFLKSLKAGDNVWFSDVLISIKYNKCEVIDSFRIEKNPIYFNETLCVPIYRFYRSSMGTIEKYTSKLTVNLLKKSFYTTKEPECIEET